MASADAMSDVPLAHLSRQQLVQLLLRIVDLLAQPVRPFQTVVSAPTTAGGPVLEPYDASLDPWNDPDLCLPAMVRVKAQRVGPTGAVGPPLHQLNPCASAFYPMVSGGPSPSRPQACSDCSSGLPRFGAVSGPGHAPSAQAVQATEGGGLSSQSCPSCENALPGCAPWVHVCGFLCGVCGTPCVLQRAGHSVHLCALHKIP